MSYYDTLEIKSSATPQEVAQAYRRLSLKWHPRISVHGQYRAYRQFCQVSEAYEVLSNGRREFYDKYGEEALKEGIFLDGALLGGYQFTGNAEQIFENVFGSSNPYNQIFDPSICEQSCAIFAKGFNLTREYLEARPAKLVVPVELTLEQIFHGCKSVVNYTRSVLNRDQRSLRQVQQHKQIVIPKGAPQGHVISFQAQGNQAPGITTSDLEFVVKAKAHPEFERSGCNLKHRMKLSLLQALLSAPLELKGLDHRVLVISFDEVVSPQIRKVVKGEGMPVLGQEGERGDLELSFQIEFPKELPFSKKSELLALLKQESLR